MRGVSDIKDIVCARYGYIKHVWGVETQFGKHCVSLITSGNWNVYAGYLMKGQEESGTFLVMNNMIAVNSCTPH